MNILAMGATCFAAFSAPPCDFAKIKPGMSEAQIVRLCGEPDRKNYRGNLRAQWAYDAGGPNYVWVNYSRLTADNELVGGRVDKVSSMANTARRACTGGPA